MFLIFSRYRYTYLTLRKTFTKVTQVINAGTQFQKIIVCIYSAGAIFNVSDTRRFEQFALLCEVALPQVLYLAMTTNIVVHFNCDRVRVTCQIRIVLNYCSNLGLMGSFTGIFLHSLFEIKPQNLVHATFVFYQ